jgi:hypothetical protein
MTALPRAALRGIGWAVPRDRLGDDAVAADGYGRRPSMRRIALGFATGVVLVWVFGSLFRTADPTFDELMRTWTEGISAATLVRATLGFVLVATVAAGAAYLVSCHIGELHPAQYRERGQRQLRPVEWAIPLAMIDVLFAVFVWTQLATLFAGDEYVLTPAGPDYAEYARDGFFRLTVVTVLTLGMTTVLVLFAARVTRTQRLLLRILGGALCVLTLVIVASALKRMTLYTNAYGFSGQRLLGYAGELWLGLVFGLMLLAGIRLRARWFPRAVAAAGVCVLLGIVAVNPDALMARTHIDRLDHNYPLDLAFLSSLSADAIAEIDALPEPQRSCLLNRMAAELARPDPWHDLNLSRQRARALIAHHPPRATGDTLHCP